MSAKEIQARVKGRIWQVIAQSGASFDAIPKEEVEAFASALTDAILQEVDDLLTADTGAASSVTPMALPAAAEAATATDEYEETVLWQGRPFLSITTQYVITTERVRIITGIMGKDREDIELVRIQHIDQSQSLGERLVNVGDIIVHSHVPDKPQVVLENVGNVLEVHEILRKAVLAARKRHGFVYREEM